MNYLDRRKKLLKLQDDVIVIEDHRERRSHYGPDAHRFPHRSGRFSQGSSAATGATPSRGLCCHSDIRQRSSLRPTGGAIRLQWRNADLAIGRAGLEVNKAQESAPGYLAGHDIILPDLLTDLQEKTQLTHRTIVRII